MQSIIKSKHITKIMLQKYKYILFYKNRPIKQLHALHALKNKLNKVL